MPDGSGNNMVEYATYSSGPRRYRRYNLMHVLYAIFWASLIISGFLLCVFHVPIFWRHGHMTLLSRFDKYPESFYSSLLGAAFLVVAWIIPLPIG